MAEASPRGKMGGLPLVLVHGGAVDQSRQPPHKIHDGVKLAARTGYQALLRTQSALDAVEAAVNVLEADPTFNAGRGSALNLMGGVEMGACIMEGTNMTSGGVALVNCVLHPISLARMVMEKSVHAILAGPGTKMFAEKMGVPLIDEENLKTQEMADALEEFKKAKASKMGGDNPGGCQDTVGCVVVDWQGRVACGCSTGGKTGKYVGRISDAPLPGCGVYCDDSIGAVSCTGDGEACVQFNLSHRILCYMKNGVSAEDATVQGLCNLGRKYGKQAGAVTISRRGEVGIGFTTEAFAWACQHANELHYGYEPGQHIVELLPGKSCQP